MSCWQIKTPVKGQSALWCWGVTSWHFLHEQHLKSNRPSRHQPASVPLTRYITSHGGIKQWTTRLHSFVCLRVCFKWSQTQTRCSHKWIYWFHVPTWFRLKALWKWKLLSVTDKGIWHVSQLNKTVPVGLVPNSFAFFEVIQEISSQFDMN